VGLKVQSRQRSKMASVEVVLIVARFLILLGIQAVTVLQPSEGHAADFTSTSLGFSFSYPDDWNMNVRPDGNGLWLRSFPIEQMPSGAIVPEGGASILLFVYPPFNDVVPNGTSDDAVIDELVWDHVPLSRTRTQDGRPARAVWEHIGLRSVDTIIHRNGKTLRLSLTCNSDDPKVSTYDQILDSIISSITLLPVE